MINIYPTHVEAVDADTGELLFRMKSFDQHAAEIDVKTLIGTSNVRELTAAIEQAVTMLELKP